MNTTIISTGEELVRGRTQDTNAAFLAAGLAQHGFEVLRILTVGDRPALLRAEVLRACRDSALIVMSGGLGPTADDRTRRAVAEAAGCELVEDAESRRFVEDRLRSFGRTATEAQLSQARFPAGSTVFPNPRGTARGFACRLGRCWLVAMPGPPGEMRPMFRRSVLPFFIDELAPVGRVLVETVHLFPVPEPVVDEGIKDLTVEGRNPSVGITVAEGVITVSVRARAENEAAAQEMVRRDVETICERFGDLVFGLGEGSLAAALGRDLEERGLTVGVAESVTGGLIGHMLVEVPGISKVFLADVVAYSNAAKVEQLGVPPGLIEAHGAVSAQVAAAMAQGICAAAHCELGISTTGIAGPTGGSPEKPVGLVYIGLSFDGQTVIRKLNLRGDRRRIKERAAKHALNLARLALKNGMDSLA